MDEYSRRIARARLLRRQGKTYDEIRAALDVPISDDAMQLWLRGIPRPRETWRSHPKQEHKRAARRMRAAGMTYDEIAERLSVSKSSLSLWLRGQPGPGRKVYDQAEHLQRIQPLGAKRRSQRAAQARAAWRTSAANDLVELSPGVLFITGIALYWAEGAKDKPWRRNGRVVIINSDPDVLEIFLAWLRLVGMPPGDLRFRLTIHETADVEAHEEWWAQRLCVSRAPFSRATLKRHNPKTIRQNTGDGYHGCLVVSVARSGWLYYSIEGWWSAIVSGTDSLASSGKLDL